MVKKLRTTAIALILAAPACWAAPVVTGTWQGTWSQDAVSGELVMTISNQAANGAIDVLSGFFDWLCTSGATCSGREVFGGSMTGVVLDVTGNLVVGSIGLGLGRYVGTLSEDRLSIAGDMLFIGTDISVGTWNANRVPEPGSLALLSVALATLASVRGLKQKLGWA